MSTPQFFAEAVADASQQILPTGGCTKPALFACEPQRTDGVARLDIRELRGIISYEASEFLITARAGTPVSELQAALEERGQYLPFDPLFIAQGSTIGGSIASGISGPNRLLYGGIRDFVMECELIDGRGKLVRGGGKVVKNAAGFDLPKLMVGSYGRLGILTEVTLKVFPRPQASATLQAEFSSLVECVPAVQRLLAQPLPVAALDLDWLPHEAGYRLMARFAGPMHSLTEVLQRAAATTGRACDLVSDASQDSAIWRERSLAIEQSVDPEQLLVRAATTLETLVALHQQLDQSTFRLLPSVAGTVTWITLDKVEADLERLDQTMCKLGISAVVVRGSSQGLVTLGNRQWLQVASRIARAMDPQGKFCDWVSPTRVPAVVPSD